MSGDPGPGSVITFYSFKGGTGRTMALANVACLLARQSTKPVLVMDWDFEAPGLHRFIRPDGVPPDAVPSDPIQEGLIDLFVAIRDDRRSLPDPKASPEEADEFVARLDLQPYLTRSKVQNVVLATAGRLDTHGRFDAGYPARVNDFKWTEFHAGHPWLFAALARRLSAEYAYVLVDSRTGFTDTSGICTMLLPEKLVVVFAPGRQSLTGVEQLVQRATTYRRRSNNLRPLAVFPLASRIEKSEESLEREWRYSTSSDEGEPLGYQPMFERLFREEFGLEHCSLEAYFSEVLIPHRSAFAYGERLAVLDEPDDRLSLSRSYERFVDYLVKLSYPWEDLEAVEQERQVGSLISKASDLVAAADLPRAEAVLTEASEAGIRVEGTHAALSDAFVKLADAAEIQREWTLAARTLGRALELAEQNLGAEHVKLLPYLIRLASLDRRGGNLGRAVSTAERAYRLTQATLGPDHPGVAERAIDIGEIYKQWGRDAESRMYFEIGGRVRSGQGAPGTHVRLVRVFVSSPGDVQEERRLARDVVHRLGKDPAFRYHLALDPILWDDPEAPAAMLATLTPQEGVNRGLVRPSECEVVIAILWSRIGTPLETPRRDDGTPYLSGTEWELEDARRHERIVLVYRCMRDPKVSLRDPEFVEKKRQLELVDEFFTRFTGPGGGLVGGYTSYESPEEFERILEMNLRQVLKPLIEVPLPATGRSRADDKRKRPRKGEQVSAASLIVPNAYRDWLKRETGSLELLGLGGSQGKSFFLSAVYVPLVSAGGDRDEDAGASVAAERSERGRSVVLLRTLGSKSLYVPGGPGSGKSTFCRWVAWLACQGAMPKADVEPPEDFEEVFPASLSDKLPVLVPLREFWGAVATKPAGGSLTSRELTEALDAWLQDRTEAARDIELAAFVEAGRTLFIFDGVDEVPSVDPVTSAERSPRRQFVTALSQAVTQWVSKGNVVLVTSRPYGLSDEEVTRIGLAVAPIADLPGELQTLLVRRWFRIQKQDAGRGDASADDLTRDVAAREWLRPLAANPLMLTAMCAIYSDGGRLPQDRHQLYDRIVDGVLTKRYEDPRRRARVRFELCAIAHAMHTGEGLDAPRREPLAQATFDEAELALRRDQAAASQREGVLSSRAAREDLLSQSGLLTARGDRALAFYHLSIQEFLAAERVFELGLDDLRTVFLERARVPGWRNTLLFLFGRFLAAFTVPTRPIALLNSIIDDLSDDGFGLQLIAGDCAEMVVAKGYPLDDVRQQRLSTLLLEAMTLRPVAGERCEAGALLGKIGDSRFDPHSWFLPGDSDAPLGFLRVGAGSFQMGSDPKLDKGALKEEEPPHLVDLPEFFIARCPVTVAQFRAFVEASGFMPRDRDCLRGVANHPVVRVSWHEALKYCDWLTGTLRSWKGAPTNTAAWLDATVRKGCRVTLPSEAEWEKAARGTDGRIYPWKDEFDPNLANTAEARIGGTSAVGAFPGGASPYGALDMSGNVWEWTRSLWGPDWGEPKFRYPYAIDDLAREDLEAPDEILRVVRGGSWYSVGRRARAALRLRYSPHYRLDFIGFRVVVSCLRS